MSSANGGAVALLDRMAYVLAALPDDADVTWEWIIKEAMDDSKWQTPRSKGSS